MAELVVLELLTKVMQVQMAPVPHLVVAVVVVVLEQQEQLVLLILLAQVVMV